MMKSSSLPPSMARRERLRSTSFHSQCSTAKESGNERECERAESSGIYSATPLQSERSRSALTALPIRGNNLAAVLRCQASRYSIFSSSVPYILFTRFSKIQFFKFQQIACELIIISRVLRIL